MNLLKALFKKIYDLKLSTKFIIAFSSIFMINLVAGYYYSVKIKDLKKLVETVYDNPLMASTYAMSAKFRFERVDALVRTIVFENDKEKIQDLSKEVISEYEQGAEDLAVVKERALTDSSKKLVTEVEENLSLYEEEINNTIDKVKNLKLVTIDEANQNLDAWINLKARGIIQQRLTDLTDDAAEAGYTFRLESEAKNTETVKVFYILSASLFIITLFFALFLTRTIAVPLLRYAAVCKEVSNNNYSKRLSVFGKNSEVAVLGDSFNHMLNKIDEKDQNMRSLLSGLNIAVFSFDKNGTVAPERSKATDLIFKNSEFNNIFEFFDKNSKITKKEITEAIDLFWGADSYLTSFESIAAIALPERLTFPVGSKQPESYIDISYKQHLNSAGQLEKIIVMAEDVTAKVFAQKNLEAQVDRIKRISFAAENIEVYMESREEIYKMVRDSKDIFNGDSQDRVLELKRKLHSLKGELTVLNNRTSSRIIHNIETELALDSFEDIDRTMQSKNLDDTEALFTQESDDVLKVLGFDKDKQSLKVCAAKIKTLKNFIYSSQENISRKDMMSFMTRLEEAPINQFFGKYAGYVERIAQSLDKEAKLIFDPNNPEVTYSEVQLLDVPLGHILRNCVDHGIETPDTRLDLGKDMTGQINISVRRDSAQNKLNIIVFDDGAGINKDRLKSKAIEKKIWTQDFANKAQDDEIVNLIFAADLSTKEVITDLSGRGVGMDVVLKSITDMGGTVKVKTEENKGTQFYIQVPFQDHSA